MPRQDLEAIVSDPEFATFSQDQRAQIVRDAQARARKKPALVTPQAADPLPAQQRLNQQAGAKQARRIGTSPPLPTLANVGRAAVEGFKDAGNMTVGAAQAGAEALMAPVNKARAEHQQRTAPPIQRAAATSPAARRIGPAPLPAPSLSEQAIGMVEPSIQAVQEARQDPSRFAPWAPGAGEGAGAFAGNVTANVLDPVGDAALAAPVAVGLLTVKMGAKGAGLALKGADRLAGDFAGRLGQATAPAAARAARAAEPWLDTAGQMAREALPTAGGRRGSIQVGRAPDGPEGTPAMTRKTTNVAAELARFGVPKRDAYDKWLTALRQAGVNPPPDAMSVFTPQYESGLFPAHLLTVDDYLRMSNEEQLNYAYTPDGKFIFHSQIPPGGLPYTPIPGNREAIIARSGNFLTDGPAPYWYDPEKPPPTWASGDRHAEWQARKDAGQVNIDTEVTPVARRLSSGDVSWTGIAGQMAKGALPRKAGREGSIRIGRPTGPGWDPAVKKANAALDASIKELRAQHAQALENGDVATAVRLADEIESLDDARVITDHRPRNPGNPASVQAARYYNPTKYAFLSPQAADKFEGALTRTVAKMRAEGRDPRTRVTRADVLRGAEEINPFSIEQKARRGLGKGESLTAVEYEAARNYLQELAEESLRAEERANNLRAQQATGGATPDEVLIAERELARIESDLERIGEVVTQSRSQKGRDLAMLKMVAQQGWDVGYWRARAERVSGGGATSQQMRDLDRIVVRGEAARQANDAAGIRQARIDLARAMGELERTPWADAFIAARKAGLLTGIKTMGRNVASNTLKTGLDEGVRALGAIPDAAISMVSGRRTTYVPRLRDVGRGLQEVRTRGVPEAHQTMLYGMPLDQLAAMEIPREVNTPSRAFNTYVNTVFRFQGAQDRLFKAYALRRSLDDQARGLAEELARQPGPRPNRATIQAYADRLAANPTDEMMREAIADAELATFQNDTALSEMWSGAKRAARNAGAKTEGVPGIVLRQTGQTLARGMDVVVPYVKTPAAIADEIINMALWRDVVTTAASRGQRIRAERRRRGGTIGPQAPGPARRPAAPIELWTPSEQKAMARGIAKGMVGSTIIWAGGQLYDRGLITGTSQPDRANEDQAAGRAPGSIKIGDQWIPLNPFSPMGNLLVLGASLARDGRDNPHFYVYHSWRTLLDQPFTQGAKQLVDTLNPGKEGAGKSFNRFMGSLAGSAVPTLIAETAQALDPEGADRDVDFSSVSSAAAGSIAKRLPDVPGVRQGAHAIQAVAEFFGMQAPGVRTDLPVKPTALGDDVDVPSGLRAYAAGAGRQAMENYDPVVREVLTLGVSLPQRRDSVRLDDNPDPVPLTQEEAVSLYRRTGELARSAIFDVIGDPDYREMSAEEKQEDIEGEIQDAAADALEEFLEANETTIRARQAGATEAQRRERGRRRAVVAPAGTP